jgi:type III restriction enzyme
MTLQFKVQDYQTAAVDAVVDVFAGQPFLDGITYRVDPGAQNAAPTMFDESGLRNADIVPKLNVLDNIRFVQKRTPGLALSNELVKSPAAPINLDVEMETGTGKTYVYIKTIMELHKRYGWSKFIVVVPSIAIREGVKKTFDITAAHFQETYRTKPRTFVYNSSRLHELERFSSDAGVQVMIINIQAFNAKGEGARRIREALDDFQSRKPIDVIAANRPILIIDEPQKIGSDPKSKTLEALREFNALFALRYSATHRVDHNKVHRLDAVDAYAQKLVKKIAVRGITVRGLAGSSAYLYVDGIEIGSGPGFPRARIELHVKTKSGITRQIKRVIRGERLHDLSGGIEPYHGLVVTDIDAHRDVIELSNGDVLAAGDVANDDTEGVKRRIQIREVIRAHLEKERQLFSQDIKVLSLFFIDEVAKYRDYTRDDTLGEYARVFEEEYAALTAEVLSELNLDEAAAAYRAYLERDSANRVHDGYFSIDKKTKHFSDGTLKKTGEDAGASEDVEAYDLILRDKEKLLSLGQPVRFIFSHSALREGWDNPNVFTLGILKKSDNNVSRRQEIGRGLRISVDQDGRRMDDPATVHEINELTVVTDESYTQFVGALQREIVESLSARPRKATAEYFANQVLRDADGVLHTITPDEGKQLWGFLFKNEFIDDDFHLTDKWFQRVDQDAPVFPPALEPYHHQVDALIDSLHIDVPLPGDGRKPKRIPFNDANFSKAEFQALWERINRKAVYQVAFDSAELIANCIQRLDKRLHVAPLQYVVVAGELREAVEADQLRAGQGFVDGPTKVEESRLSAGSTVPYDLLGEIAEKTKLTRRTCAAILTGVKPTTFDKFKENPEQFITETSKLINEQKATVIVEHLTYDPLDARYASSIFTENQTAQDLSAAGPKLNKSVYDFVVTDSKVERAFVTELDKSEEVVVYTKLPRGFSIPTPVGDYNPDWAVAFKEGAVKHVYFVAETKGSLSSLQLKGIEEAKIECARKFFAALEESSGAGVRYDVVTTFDDLMQLVL